MAKDNKASFVRIGFTLIIATLAIVGTLVYLGGIRGSGDKAYLETYYTKGVSGLAVGSAVNLRGVKIGEVSEIGFVGVKYPESAPPDHPKIYICMAIDYPKLGIRSGERYDIVEDVRAFIAKSVSKGMRATVTSSGITGLSRIELDFFPLAGAETAADLSWRPKHAFVPPKIGLLDSFSDSATKVMNQINKMDLNAAWTNIANSVESLSRATDSVRLLLESRQGDFEKIFDNLTAATRSVRELTDELKRNPALLIRERRRSSLPETSR